jgi:hypothetical protein
LKKRFEDSKDLKPKAEVQILQWSKEQKDKRTNNDLQNIAQTNQDRYHELIDRNERSIYQMAIDLSLLSFFPLPPTRPLHNLSF